ncbi:MAG: hypothetical protein ACXWYS_00290 [Gaiellaceae bacterium]
MTIELSEQLAAAATTELASLANVRVVQGDSATELPQLTAAGVPTLYWLDGHWSGSETAGTEHECPVLDEVAAIAAGNPSDCILIDDARLFAAAPPPPHDPAAWPSLVEVFDALREGFPAHHVTVLRDIVLAVPASAHEPVDRFGRGELDAEPEAEPEPSMLDRLLQRVKR